MHPIGFCSVDNPTDSQLATLIAGLIEHEFTHLVHTRPPDDTIILTISSEIPDLSFITRPSLGKIADKRWLVANSPEVVCLVGGLHRRRCAVWSTVDHARQQLGEALVIDPDGHLEALHRTVVNNVVCWGEGRSERTLRRNRARERAGLPPPRSTEGRSLRTR